MMMSFSQTSSILAPLFILLSIKLSYCSILIACPEIEKQSLLIFKQSLKDPSNFLSSWNGTEVNCCEWGGVFCSNLTGHVNQLHLPNCDLSGKINPSLLNLKHLTYLDLSQNNFEETIPPFIGSLASLEYLNLSGAGFYGNIPHTVGNLSNLHTLSFEEMTYSERELDVDSLEWLSGLSKLDYLNMNHVNLSKTSNLKQVINKLPSLSELHLSNCSLNDFAADPFNVIFNISHSNLAILDLSSNSFQSFATLQWTFQLRDLIFLDLSRNSFEGQIPSISNTTKLKYIDLSVNNFNSSIPEWLYSCKDLEFVNLQDNALQNEISNSIANLTSLNRLDLSSNALSGKIPREIANLCNIHTLLLFGNKLEGEVSNSFGNMSDCFLGALEILSLGDNHLSGNLTHQFGEFKSLMWLDLSRNSFSGVIPINIGDIYSLKNLDLSDNKLIGNLPEGVGQLFNLTNFSVEDNMLEGVVSETHFAHLSNLKYFHASRNHLTFKVSPNWIPPFKLEGLRLGSINLGEGSSFPSWLGTQKKDIRLLDLSCTGISSSVPSWIWNIRYLNLSHNHLNTKIPAITDPEGGNKIPNRFIYLSSNKFSGPLPRILNTVTELDLSNNSFSGDLSHILYDDMLSNETYKLEILHVGRNHLTGELPDFWMKLPSLRVLNLRNNNFSGRIPNSIGFLSNLLSLNLDGNKFSRQIPYSMHSCKEILKIDVSRNNLDGNIPEWIGTSLTKLKFLILRSNKLSGEITSTICLLSSLQILDLSDNKLLGIIPRCVDNFTAMATKRNRGYGIFEYSPFFRSFLESASIATKGTELHYDTIIGLVTSIDLSENNLSGDIPNEITSLVELRTLNLSRNHLTGLIPYNIGNMKQLESLDFSINSLSGVIPSSFTVMSTLSHLNFSYNNLSGRIPESTQISGFPNSSFIGNNLCGPQLIISCSKDGDEKGDHRDKSEIEWLYVSVSLGYAVGLSAFIAVFFLKNSWWEACYEFFEDMVNGRRSYR